MHYQGLPDFRHETSERIGVLITNLGTPDAPERGPLRRYLKQFLWDPRVVEVSRPLWALILHGIILNTRPARSAEAYRSVWTEEGSPLLLHTRDQAEALQASLTARYGHGIDLRFAMRYGSPSIPDTLQAMLDGGIRKLLVLPLYPQYSGATTGSTFDALAADFTRRRWLPELRFVASYHDHPAYIDALASSIRQHWESHGRADRLLLSYHGEPERYLHAGDPYHCHCHKTSRLLAEALDLGDDDYLTCFQSRFGRETWLQPYTDETLKSLPGQGVRSVQVVCPGFSADCLETLEEIGVENRDYFLEAGGERYEFIPCLNATEGHIEALATILDEQLQGWLPLEGEAPEATRERALRAGAKQ
ncbi:MAG: ferrochelatase [Haliea sp.]|nr:ferrochelatase [Haliea sp.]